MPDSEQPDGWRLAKLAELAEVVGGTTPSRNADGYFGGSIPWATPTDITRLSGHRFIGSTEAAITEKGRAAAGLRILPPGTILMTSRATIGSAAIARVPITTNQGFQNLIPNDDVEPLWLYYAVTGQRRLLERLAAGSTFREASRNTVRSLELLVPPRSEQRRIAEVIDSIDAAIEQTEAVIAATERLRSALLRELLTRGVPGWHTEWKEVPGIGTIPACWGVVRLGEVAPISYGTSVPTSHAGTGLPVLRIPNVARGVIDLTDLKFALDPTTAEPETRKDDLLIVRTNGNPDICGTFALVPELTEKVLFASYLMRIRTTNRKLLPAFIAAFLNTTGRAQLRGRIRTSAGNYNISASGLASVEVPVPSENEQVRMLEALDSIDARRAEELKERDRLVLVKQGLANALLSGQVRVRGKPNG